VTVESLDVFSCFCCVGRTPGLLLVRGGRARSVGDSLMPEGEDARLVVLRSSFGYAGGNAQVLQRTVRSGRVAAVTPIVGHHSSIGVDHGSTPGHWRGCVRALVVLDPIVLEGEDAQGSLEGVARVRNSPQL